MGLINVLSTNNKDGPLHETIRDEHLDVMDITETWIPEDSPPAVTGGLALAGYGVLHFHRKVVWLPEKVAVWLLYISRAYS